MSNNIIGFLYMSITLYQDDLPSNILQSAKSLAIDTEATGLSVQRDRLCLVQISDGNGDVYLVQFFGAGHQYNCPNLKRLLLNDDVLKIFHFARFDIMMLEKALNINLSNIYCTKVASKMVRTFTERHGLRDLARELIGVDINKQQQTSDWGAQHLSEAQQTYAASDVLYLHQLKDALDPLLKRENRTVLAQACFDFLPTRSRLDVLGWDHESKDFSDHA